MDEKELQEFKDKIRSIGFSRVKTQKVKDQESGRELGEQHYHNNGDVGATVFAEHKGSGLTHKKPEGKTDATF